MKCIGCRFVLSSRLLRASRDYSQAAVAPDVVHPVPFTRLRSYTLTGAAQCAGVAFVDLRDGTVHVLFECCMDITVLVVLKTICIRGRLLHAIPQQDGVDALISLHHQCCPLSFEWAEIVYYFHARIPTRISQDHYDLSTCFGAQRADYRHSRGIS